MSILQLAASAQHGVLSAVVLALVAAAIKGSVLLALALLVTTIFRRASAAARHLIWATALGGMLLVPVISPFMPAIRASVVPKIELPRFDAVTLPVDGASALATGTSALGARPSAPPPSVQSRVPSAESRAPARRLADYLPLIWLAGALLILARLALGTLRVFIWSRNAVPVDDGGWLALTQRLAARLDIARPVILRRSDRACVPMTWGIVYPTVLLPSDADAWTTDRRTIVLMHELAHVKRLDAFTQLIAQVAVGLFWFNPLVWLAAAQMRTEREHACDDFVIAAGARASDYAQDLLQIARSLGRSSAPATAALAMARRSEFEGRLLAILDPTTDRRSVSRPRLLVATAGVLLMTLPLAALRPVQARVAPQTNSAAPVGDTPVPTLGVKVARQAMALDSVGTRLSSAASRLMTKIGGSVTPETLPRVKQPPPDRETLISVARAAAKMTSDYEKAELLLTIAKHYMPDDELRTIYLDAVSSMTSDYERGRTLAPLMLKDELTGKALQQVVKIASSMTSDYEKAQLLIRTTQERNGFTANIEQALVEGATAIKSDYDRGRTLTAILKRGGLSAAELVDVLQSVEKMTSNYDKANILVVFASTYPLTDPGVHKAFFKAADTITTGDDYRRVMTNVLK